MPPTANSADMHKHVFYSMSRCRYFDSIPSQKYSNVLSCLQAKVRTFRKGEIIFRFHQQSNYAGIVVRGMVQQNIYAALRLRVLRKYYARQIVQCFFATQVMQLNLRLRIMSQKHIRSKVKIFLQNEKINENDLPSLRQWKEI